MPYTLRRNILVLIVALLGCALAACGKKGPLYLPDQPRKSAKKAPAASEPSQTETTGDAP